MKVFNSLLARRVFTNLAVGIAIITIFFSCLSYYLSNKYFQREIEEQLAQFVQNRHFFESDLFVQAQKNVVLVRNNFLRQLEKTSLSTAEKRFAELIRPDEHGVLRIDPQFDDYRNKATVSIYSNAKLDLGLKREVLQAYDLISQFGPAFRLRYHTTFIDLGDNEASVVYSPEVNYARVVPAHMAMGWTAEALVYAANHGQKDKVYWTDIYYDNQISQWLVSVIAPIVGNGHYYGRVGMDVLLSQLIDLINVGSIEGSYNMIVGKNGELIAHPSKMQQIRDSKGYLSINYLQDAELSQIYEAISYNKNAKNLIKTKDDQFMLGIIPLPGTKWFFVTVYPKKLIQKKAATAASVVLVLGLLMLLAQLFYTARVLKRDIAMPVGDLQKGVSKLAHGQEEVTPLHINRPDEIGVLAKDFELMANKLKSYQDEVEIEVKVRTDTLSQRNQVLLEANAELIRQEKDKNMVLVMIANTLKNSVVGIKEIISLLRSRITVWPQEKTISKLAIVDGLSAHLVHLLENTLDAGMLEAGKYPINLETVALQPFFQELRKYYQSRLEEKRQVLVIQCAEVFVEADQSALWHVLDNLLSNACKFTPQHGNVMINVVKNETHVEISVEDQGPGVAMHEQAKLFRKLSQLSMGSQAAVEEYSTGLGLFIVAQLLSLMGGEIRCDSQFGQGAKFIFTLPLDVR